MTIAKTLLLTAFNLALIYMLVLNIKKPEKMYVDAEDKFVFSKGNASEAVRSEILHQLNRFQEGYSKRDDHFSPGEARLGGSLLLLLSTIWSEAMRDLSRGGGQCGSQPDSSWRPAF